MATAREALTDLQERLNRAHQSLMDSVVHLPQDDLAKRRVYAKAEGVRLALSYVEEGLR